MAWVVSQLSERLMYRHSLLREFFATATNKKDLSLCPADYARGHASYPTEVSGQVALVGKPG
jgi:hypothetical protein